MMESISNNKALVCAYFDSLCQKDPQALRPILHDDLTYWIAGNTVVSGTINGAENYIASIYDFLNIIDGEAEFSMVRMTAEDDRVAVEAKSSIMFRGNIHYTNAYHMLFVIADGLILEVREYMDTQHVADVFAKLKFSRHQRSSV